MTKWNEYRYVTLNGGVWKLTPKRYKMLRGELARTGNVANMDDYGPMITARVETLNDIIGDLPRVNDDNNWNEVASN